MGLQQIQAGAVGWDGTMNANIAFLRLPPGYVQGLLPTWLSSTQISVAPGNARDSADQLDMNLGSATTVDITEPYWRVIKEGAVPEKDIAEVLKGT